MQYELLESIKTLGKSIRDQLSGKTTADAIENELSKYRNLSVGVELEPTIVLKGLRALNMIKAAGLNEDDLNEIIKAYLKRGIK